MNLIGIVIASLGGLGGIVLIARNLIVKYIEKGIEQKYNEKLAVIRAEIEKKQYISQVRFDKEFEIYCGLSKKFGLTILKMMACISDGYCEKEDISYLVGMLNSAVEELYMDAPFMKKEVYIKYIEIYEQCRELICQLEKRDYNESYSENLNEIYKKNNKLIDDVRDYVKKLEVISM